MSGPTIPDFSSVRLTREDSLVLLLASIAREQIALAHLVNAEAESLRSASGAVERMEVGGVADMLRTQESARHVLEAIALKEFQVQLLLTKMT